MTSETVLDIGRDAIWTTIALVMVLLLPALAVGLLVSIFQAATQIQEQTLSFIPKILITFIVLLVAGPWLLATLIEFIQRLIGNIPILIG